MHVQFSSSLLFSPLYFSLRSFCWPNLKVTNSFLYCIQSTGETIKGILHFDFGLLTCYILVFRENCIYSNYKVSSGILYIHKLTQCIQPPHLSSFRTFPLLWIKTSNILSIHFSFFWASSSDDCYSFYIYCFSDFEYIIDKG